MLAALALLQALQLNIGVRHQPGPVIGTLPSPSRLTFRRYAMLGAAGLLGMACDAFTGRGAQERAKARPLEREPYAAALMPRDLGGIALGMDWTALAHARPGLKHGHSPGVDTGPYDYMTDFTDSSLVMFAFSDSTRPDTAFARALPAGVLSVVQISRPVAASADINAYQRAVASLVARWDSLIGPADDVTRCWTTHLGDETEPHELRVWRRPDVILALASTPDDYLSQEAASGRRRGRMPLAEAPDRTVTMVIQSARLRLGAGFDPAVGLSGCRPEALQRPPRR